MLPKCLAECRTLDTKQGCYVKQLPLPVDNLKCQALYRRLLPFPGREDFIEGLPELVVVIAATSASYDLHDKMNVCRRNGVQEYVVWQVYDRRVDRFRLQEGAYRPLPPGEEGVIRCRVFPGLHLAVESLLTGELAQVLVVLQKGLEMAEHQAYTESMSGR